MKCPYCGSKKLRVVDSRPTTEDTKIRRRRECEDCEKKFTTYEIIETIPLTIKKSNGSIQEYNRDKLFKGILTAVKKRSVSRGQIEEIINKIENKFANEMIGEVTTAQIGSEVLEFLKQLDTVAYVRFASVYKDFDNVEDFINIIKDLERGDI